MIFSVSDKGGLEEKKFCPIRSPSNLIGSWSHVFTRLIKIRSYISTAVPSHSFTRSLQAYPHIYKKQTNNNNNKKKNT